MPAVPWVSLPCLDSFRPRTRALVPLTGGAGSRAEDAPVLTGGIASPRVVIATRHKGSCTQRHINMKMSSEHPERALGQPQLSLTEISSSITLLLFPVRHLSIPGRGWPCSGHGPGWFRKRGWWPQTPGALISSAHTHQLLAVYFVQTLFRAPELSKTRCNQGQLELQIK